MRLYVVLGLILIVIVLVVLSMVRGRRPAFFVISLLIVLISLNGWSEFVYQKNLATSTQVVKELSKNKDSYVHCQRLSETFSDLDKVKTRGYVMSDDVDRVVIRYDTCADLFNWLERNELEESTPDEIGAFGVLVHEAYHSGGEFDEAITECLAMKNYVDAAVMIGVSPERAVEMQEYYVTNLHPLLPNKYKGGEC